MAEGVIRRLSFRNSGLRLRLRLQHPFISRRTVRLQGRRHEMKKRRQHHVWQRYLKSWTVDDKLFCLRDGRIFVAGTHAITVTVHLIDRAFLAGAWPTSSMSQTGVVRRPVIAFPFVQPVGLIDPARSGRFVERNQPDATCPVPLAKIFPFPSDANHLHIPCHPGPHTRGVSRSSRT